MQQYDIFPLGDHGLTIGLGNTIDESVNERCLSIATALSRQNIPGVKDIVPAYSTVSVIYDPSELFRLGHIVSPYRYMRQRVEEVLDGDHPLQRVMPRTMRIPACFDLSFAPDLLAMAEQKGMSTGQIIHLFTATTWRVYMIGFLPGFAYMGKADDAIAMPRKEKPHAEIRPGSIGIAGNQAGIYPLASPGGWNIIGRTPLRLFHPDNNEPCLLKAGDKVLFESIGLDTFHHLNQYQ